MSSTLEALDVIPRHWRTDWYRNGWLRFVAGRAMTLLIGVAVILAVTYFAVRLIPGDAARAGTDVTATPEFIAARRHALGLDQPLLAGLLDYAKGAVTLDFGTSFVHGQPVLDLIAPRAAKTAELALAGFVVCLGLGIPTGLLAGVAAQSGKYRVYGRLFGLVSGILTAVPEYLIGAGLVYLFSISMNLLPPAGSTGLAALVLPALALGLGTSATLARVTKVEVVRILDEDYIRTARGNRLRMTSVYLRHVLPNLTPAVLTYAGLILGTLAGGAVIVESVFAWPGLGTALIGGVTGYDYPVVQGIVAVVAVAVMVVNAMVDLVVALVDPRSLAGGA